MTDFLTLAERQRDRLADLTDAPAARSRTEHDE